MTRLFNSCRKYREGICAMASGAVAAGDGAELERHLQSCADCQSYQEEIGSIAVLLSPSGQFFSDVEPRETAQMRWTSDFEAAIKPPHSIATKLFLGFLEWSRDMIWPVRRIWAGLTAIWLVILGLNASQTVKETAQHSHRPSPEMMRALLAREGFLSGPDRIAEDSEVESPRPSSPQSRSEHPKFL